MGSEGRLGGDRPGLIGLTVQIQGDPAEAGSPFYCNLHEDGSIP